MSSTHIGRDTQNYDNGIQLRQLLLERVGLLNNGSTPVVLAIAGGSASGKTTLATDLTQSFGVDKATLFSQDLFQLGSDFTGRKTSPYKWDDPENFDINACFTALADIKNGHDVVMPRFDVIANRRLGTVVIPARSVVIWEGLYALLTPEMRQIADITVFVDAPYVLRLLRRISRFLDREQIDDISVPARHMLSFVSRADTDFVAKQRASADYVLRVCPNAQELTHEVELFRQRATKHVNLMPSPTRRDLLQSIQYAGLSFEVHQGMFVIATGDGQAIYAAALEPDLIPLALATLKHANTTIA